MFRNILGMLDFLTTRQPDISYDFIFIVYSVAVALCLVLLVLDKVLLISDVQGFWVVLTPFIPCLLWVMVIKRQPEARSPEEVAKKND